MISLQHTIEQPVIQKEATLCDAILRVLLYYDLFDYPLTTKEISLFLETAQFGLEEIEEALRFLAEDNIVRSAQGYWFLGDQTSQIVRKRLRMEEEGERMWNIARRFARFMRMVPFVRAVFISGQLSRYIADQKSDIDYFIVTAPGRLWIVRTIFVLFRRTVLLNNRKFFCTNYYVTTDNLEIRERNPYVACETASLKPLWNSSLFEKFARANHEWINLFYPNFDYRLIERREGIPERRSLIQRLVESLIPQGLAKRLDTRLLKSTREFWHQKFPEREEEFYQSALLCRPDESRAHPDDLSSEIMRRYNASLKRYGLSAADE